MTKDKDIRPMETLDAIRTRRAVKQYDPDHRIPDADLDTILSAGMLAPTAFNIQHWRFVLVTDPALRRQIRAVAWDQAQVTDASVLIVMCADMQAWRKDPAHYWADAPQDVQNLMAGLINQYYEGRPQVQRDETMRSCAQAAQTMMLAAASLGYQSCPMDGFDFDAVAKLINLPDDHVITMFVALGKGTQAARPRASRLTLEQVRVRDRFA
ncbi:nitroreductase family protein [Gluconacetobacter azotocaptans]|uniref:nitroreductase family protein n=1 Tax=Gluconacetobacter azotocaptans TaxID=142834 RepID=UPI0038D0C29F